MPGENELQFSHSDVQAPCLWLIPCLKVNSRRQLLGFNLNCFRFNFRWWSIGVKPGLIASHRQASCFNPVSRDTFDVDVERAMIVLGLTALLTAGMTLAAFTFLSRLEQVRVKTSPRVL
jgi:hypothetical protein